MTELEQLIEQRKELDKKIKELTCPVYEVAGAKLFVHTRHGKPTNSWSVTVMQIGGNGAYKELVSDNTKEGAIEGLYNLIYSLNGLASLVDENGEIADKMRG